MKLNIIALLAIFSAGADAQCDFCSNGLSVESSVTVKDSGDGETCGSLAESAPTIDADEYFCTVMKMAEGLCCPPVAVADDPSTDDNEFDPPTQEFISCPVCADGLTVKGETIPEAQGASCDELIGYALNVDESSDACTEMKGAELICCPDDPAVSDATDQPTKQVTTAPPVVQEDTTNQNSCPVCSEGLTVDEDLGIGRGTTCGSLVADALDVDESSDMCSDMKEAESICCPTSAESPCPVCSEGLTVDGSVVIRESDGTTLTCGGLVVDALNAEESSRTCSQMMSAETICCPASIENPCTICPEGLTVDEDLDVGEGTYTCGGLVADALNFEESSEICSQMKRGEVLCCPNEPSATVPTATPLTSSVPTAEDVAVEKLSPGPTVTPLTSSSSVPTSKDTTSGNASSVPTTRSRISSSPTSGVAPTIGLPITSSPTQLVARPSPSPISWPTSYPAESTASPVIVIIESTASPTVSPVMVEIESTSSPTTPSPVAPWKENQANSEPVFAEPPSNKSTCLVAPGVIGFVLTSIVSTMYAMASIL